MATPGETLLFPTKDARELGRSFSDAELLPFLQRNYLNQPTDTLVEYSGRTIEDIYKTTRAAELAGTWKPTPEPTYDPTNYGGSAANARRAQAELAALTAQAIDPARPQLPGETFNQYLTRIGHPTTIPAQQPASPQPAPSSQPAPQVAGTTTQAPPVQPASLSDAQLGITAQDYQVKPGETTQQYQARLAALRAGKQPIQPISPPQQPSTAPKSGYTGVSVVDYLNSVGQDSSFASRSKLALSKGIQRYTGTVQQNTQLLNSLRGGVAGATAITPQPSVAPPSPPAPPAPPEPSFQQQTENLLREYGITPADPNKNPVTSTADIIQQLYTQLGIPDIKTQFDLTQKKYTDLQNELTDKISQINDNPWISEGDRSKRVISLQNKYEAKTTALTSQLKLYESMYDRARQDAQFIAGKALDISHQQDVQRQDYLFKALDLAEKAVSARRTAEQPTSNMKEYILAVNEGFTGNFTDWKQTSQKSTGIVAEYEYYVAQEQAAGRRPMSFNAYQTADANRRRTVINNYSAPYEIPGVGTVQRNIQTGNIDVLKAEPKGGGIEFTLPSGAKVKL